MNKKGYKRIIGLCIFALTAMLFGIVDVNADACDKVSNEKILQQYGLAINYDETAKVFKVISKFNKEAGDLYNDFNVKAVKFKITELYFYEPYGIEVDDDGNPIGEQITDAEMIKNYGSYTGFVEKYNGSIDDLVNNNMIKTLNLGSNSTIDVNPKIFEYSADKGENKFGIAFKIVPDGFKDPEVKKACGANATFFAIVHAAFERGEDEEPEELDNGVDASGNYESKWLDCTNYQSFNKNSFDYKFCADKDASVGIDGKQKKAGTKKFTIEKNKNIIIKYEDGIKNTDNTYQPGRALSYKCDYTVSENSSSTSEYYTNKNYLYGSGTYTINLGTYKYSGEYTNTSIKTASCEIKCEEVVKVEYGPPVASKAGLCFEYKVKVTSRVNCEGKTPNEPPKQVVCTPTPYCKHSNGQVWHMAGPNDDFDECVQTCDGGVYSDRCVNKCYKQVYGESIVRQTTGTEIAYDDAETTETDITKKANVHYQFKTTSSGGIYWDSNGKTRKKGKSTGATRQSWSKVVDADSYWHKHHKWGASYSVYNKYTGNGVPEKLGCDDIKCWWEVNKKSACTTTTNYRYYNHPNVYKAKYTKSHGGNTYTYKRADGKDFSGQSSYEKDREYNKDLYNRLVKQCKAYAACNTTTAEFTISVKYTEKGDTEKTTTINFPYTENNDKNSKDSITHNDNDSISCPTNANSIILKSRGCYNCGGAGANISENEGEAGLKKMYMTEWSFPGTWIHNKTGKISYKPVNEVTWRKIKEKFCLPLNAGNVNAKWYNYYQNTTKGNDTSYTYYDQDYIRNVQCPDGTTVQTKCGTGNAVPTENDIDYNIKATARKFGLFEWDIDIKCFYAVNDIFPKEKETDKCSLTCSNEQYRVRSVDLSNLFPATSGDSETRTPGFNWSTYANQTEKDKDYISTPANYAKWIQYTAKNGGVYTDEYLDYEVTLTKEIISEIKKSANKEYTKWEGETINIDDESSANSYRSPLFKDGGILSGNSVYPSGNALKCNNIGTHTATRLYDAECAEFKDYDKEGK